MADEAPSKKLVAGLYKAMLGRARSLAPHFEPGDGSKKLTPDDELTVWNYRELDQEQEWELWRAVKPDGTPQLTPEEIGDKVFPKRRPLITGGGRIEPKEQIAYAMRIAKRAQQRAEAEQTTPEMPAVPGWEGEL